MKKIFNLETGKKQAIANNHKYLPLYIWGQAHLENENISYLSAKTFIETMNSVKLPLSYRFQEGENYSEYTIDLLNGLKQGWDEILNHNKNGKKKLRLNQLIQLNDTLSKFEPSKPTSGLRTAPVSIVGCSYKPDCVINPVKVEKELNDIWTDDSLTELERSIELLLYIAKTQMFYDGNKRTAVLTASYNLIRNGIASGIFINPESKMEFKRHLVSYYENKHKRDIIANHLKRECIDFVPEFKKTDEYKTIIDNYSRVVFNVNLVKKTCYSIDEFLDLINDVGADGIEFIEEDSNPSLLKECKEAINY